MRICHATTIAAGLFFAGAAASQAAPVSFTLSEENGISSVDTGTVAFDSADPSSGTITFGQILVGDPDEAPPLFTATTVGPIAISITLEGDELVIEASGTGLFTFDDRSTSGGTLSASAAFFPYDPLARTLDGSGSIGARSTTGIAGAAINGGTLLGASFVTPTTVPLPASIELLGSALLALGIVKSGLSRRNCTVAQWRSTTAVVRTT